MRRRLRSRLITVDRRNIGTDAQPTNDNDATAPCTAAKHTDACGVVRGTHGRLVYPTRWTLCTLGRSLRTRPARARRHEGAGDVQRQGCERSEEDRRASTAVGVIAWWRSRFAWHCRVMAKDPREQVFNGSFDTGAAGWFSAGADMSVVDGKLRVQVPGGRRQPFDVIVGQNDIPLERSAQYTIAFTASASRPVTIRTQVQLSDEPYTATWSQNVGLDTSPKQYQFSFTSNLDTDQGQVAFQIGGQTRHGRSRSTTCPSSAAPRTSTCRTPARGSGSTRSATCPTGPKNATVVTDATDAAALAARRAPPATVVAIGQHHPARRGRRAPGRTSTPIDFSSLHHAPAPATRCAPTARPATRSTSPTAVYEQLRADALQFFYPQRSGIADRRRAARPATPGPPATSASPPTRATPTCRASPASATTPSTSRGGWYDAGDHGKYVVNGGISVCQLMSDVRAHQDAPRPAGGALGDGTLGIPEQRQRRARTSSTRPAGSWSSC